MIAFILAKFINTVGPKSVASNAVKKSEIKTFDMGVRRGWESVSRARGCVTPATDLRLLAASSATFGG